MTHRRSKKGMLKQAVRKYIFRTSFQDHTLSETICRCDRLELIDYAASFSVEVKPSDIPIVERGEVLMDSRGRGSAQKIRWR